MTTLAGRALASITAAVARLRHGAKPLHPHGTLYSGRLVRHGTAGPRTGCAWLDEPGTDDVVVRRSRALGLPRGLPDIHGVAVRVCRDDRAGDLLFASTGWGPIGRFLLTAARSADARPLTTLLPYRTPGGPVVLGLIPSGEDSFRLHLAAPPAGGWRRLGELELARSLTSTDISFDPVLNRVPGLDVYRWVVRLREPAYRRARRSRA